MVVNDKHEHGSLAYQTLYARVSIRALDSIEFSDGEYTNRIIVISSEAERSRICEISPLVDTNSSVEMTMVW